MQITRGTICSADGYFFLEDQGIPGVELTFTDGSSVKIWSDGSIVRGEVGRDGYVQNLDEAVADACRYLGL